MEEILNCECVRQCIRRAGQARAYTSAFAPDPESDKGLTAINLARLAAPHFVPPATAKVLGGLGKSDSKDERGRRTCAECPMTVTVAGTIASENRAPNCTTAKIGVADVDSFQNRHRCDGKRVWRAKPSLPVSMM
jgi:hypothetical protein